MPVGLDSTETLGRGVFSRGHIKPSKGKVKYQAFLEQGCSSLSVDRCDDALIDTLVHLGEKRAKARSEASGVGRTFYGWAKLTVAAAEGCDRQVIVSPCECNPYHADIELPDDVKDDAARTTHAIDLARIARWCGRPASP